MSVMLTYDELEHYRVVLKEHSEALLALDEIADCDGDLEDAAINLAIQVGLEPNTSDRWLDGIAKRWRHVLCQSELKEGLSHGLNPESIAQLATSTSLPLKLATPIAIYVTKVGVQDFCLTFESKIQ